MSSLSDILRDIDVGSADAYLKFHGWELAHQGELGDRWRLKLNGRTRNIAVPRISSDHDDRIAMMRVVLSTLAEVEHRDPSDIALDLDSAGSDMLEFRVAGSSFVRGEIPLPSAPELADGAFEAVQSAARAEVTRRPHYAGGQIPAAVREFVDEAKLVGTAKGSVILRLRAPAPPAENQERIVGMPNVPSYERRVVRRLVEAVKAAKTAAHRDPATLTPDVLDEDVDLGLSANLCSALWKLSGSKSVPGDELSLRVHWSLAEPVDDLTTEVTVDRHELKRIEEVAEILRGVQPSPDTTVEGPVVQLRRSLDEPEGRITIAAEIEGKVRSVQMEVAPEDHQKAIEAYQSDGQLRATGTLEHAGTSRELTHIRSVERISSSS